MRIGFSIRNDDNPKQLSTRYTAEVNDIWQIQTNLIYAKKLLQRLIILVKSPIGNLLSNIAGFTRPFILCLLRLRVCSQGEIKCYKSIIGCNVVTPWRPMCDYHWGIFRRITIAWVLSLFYFLRKCLCLSWPTTMDQWLGHYICYCKCSQIAGDKNGFCVSLRCQFSRKSCWVIIYPQLAIVINNSQSLVASRYA